MKFGVQMQIVLPRSAT